MLAAPSFKSRARIAAKVLTKYVSDHNESEAKSCSHRESSLSKELTCGRGWNRRHNSDFHQETFKVLCKDVDATTTIGDRRQPLWGTRGWIETSRAMKIANARQTETGSEREKKEKERETDERREKKATAETHQTFDLFKWADRLSHEGAICFFLESFSHIPNPILSPRLFLFLPLPRSISNGFHTAIVNVKIRFLINLIPNLITYHHNIVKSRLLHSIDKYLII